MSEGQPLQCGACESQGEHLRFRAVEMMFGTREEFEYFACTACGCLQLVRIPEDPGEYYPADYYSFDVAEEGVFKRFLKRRRARHLMRGPSVTGRLAAWWFGVPDYFSWIEATGVQPADAILDVGCGGGQLLLQMRDLGFHRLTGIDPYLAGEVFHPGGIGLLPKRIHEVEGEFDLVMLHHSFEHMASPREVLRHVHRLLKPGALALIRIPIADSWASRHYGTDWVQLDAPRHLFLHTRRSMSILAEAAGLRMERVVHDSNAFQFWGSEQYRRGIPLRHPRSYLENPRDSSFSAPDVRRFNRLAAVLNERGEGDQAAFHLRKPHAP